eukprot:gene20282-22268_t
MEPEFRLRDSDVLITDSVLDFSKYLTSSDLPESPEEFFDDLFDAEQLEKNLPAQVKIKEEPCYSTSSSRCSTPESLLPEHDFENTEFPSPQFYANDYKKESLVYQLHSVRKQKYGNTASDAEVQKKYDQLFIGSEYDSTSCDEESISAANSPCPTRKGRSVMKTAKRKMFDKGTDEYRLKRERNNIAVRKSRNKTKMKQLQTEVKVSELNDQNEQLKNKVLHLQRELAALRNFVALNSPSLVAKAPGFFKVGCAE